MRIRTILASSALAASLITSTSLISPSFAQRGVVSSPLTGWAVTKVDDANGNYCAMARKFTSDTVMTFAQNDAQESSFAVDFQRPVFQPGQSVSVTLDPGAGQQRVYNLKPVSANAFVVKLGRDDSFFQALDTTGFLRIEAGTQSYHFNVSDINAGQSRLDGCIAAMVMPAAGDEMALTPAPVAAVPVAAPSADVQAMKEQITSLNAQNAALSQKLSSLQAQASAVSATNQNSNIEIDTLKSQINALHQENARLKADVQTANVHAASAQQIASMPSKELETLQAENLRLKAQMQTLTKSDADVDALNAQITALKTENKNLAARPQASKSQEEEIARLTSRIGELQFANKDLTESLTKIEGALAIAKSSADIETREASTLKAENAALSNRLKELASSQQSDTQSLRTQLAQAEQDKARLSAQMDDTSRVALSEKSEALQKLRAEKDAQIAALETKLAAQEKAQKTQDAQLLEIGDASAELERLKSDNEALQQKVAMLEDEASGKDALTERLATLEKENATLRDNLARSTDQDSVKLTALMEENAALKTQIEAQTHRISELESLNKEIASVSDKDARIAELEAELAAAALAHSAEVEELTAELTALQGKYAALEADMSAQTQKFAALSSAQEEALLNQDSSKAHTEIAALEEKLSLVAVENRELKNKLDAAMDAMSYAESAVQPQPVSAANEEVRDASARSESPSPSSTEASTWNSEVAEQATQNARKSAPVPPRRQAAQAEPAVLQPASYNPRNLAPVQLTPPSKESSRSLLAPVALSAPVEKSAMNVTPDRALPQEDERNLTKVLDDLTPAAGEEKDGLSASDALDETAPSNEALLSPQAPVAVSEGTVQPMAQSEPAADMTGLSEAQRQEMAISQNVKTQGSLLEQAKAEARRNLLQAAESNEVAAPVEVSASEDPFEEIAVEQPEAYQSVEGAAVEEVGVEEPLNNTVSAQPIEAEVLPETDMVQAATDDIPAEGATAVSILEADEAPTGGYTLAQLLESAHVTSASEVQQVAPQAGDDFAYSWQQGNVYGTAEQRLLHSPEEFDVLVKQYLERTQQRCPGDFAIVPSQSIGGDMARADSYEVACVSGQVSAGASLLFFNQEGVFTVVAHEAPTNDLGQAIDSRDKVMRLVTQGS